jgi:hypothetical protein
MSNGNGNDKDNLKKKSQYEYGSIPEVSNNEEEGSTTSSNSNSNSINNNEDEFDYEAFYRDSLSIRTSPVKKAVFGIGATFLVVFLVIAAVGNNGPATMQKARSAPLRNVSQQRIKMPWLLAHGPKPVGSGKNKSHDEEDEEEEVVDVTLLSQKDDTNNDNVTATDEKEDEDNMDCTVKDDDAPLDKGGEDNLDSSDAQTRPYFLRSLATMAASLSLLIAGSWW